MRKCESDSVRVSVRLSAVVPQTPLYFHTLVCVSIKRNTFSSLLEFLGVSESGQCRYKYLSLLTVRTFVGDSLKPEKRDLGCEDLGGELEGKQRQVND